MSLTVLDFSAEWCGPCQEMAPHFKSLKKKYKNIKFVNVDVDVNETMVSKYRIKAVPTFLFLHNNNEVGRIEGADLNKLTAMVENLANLANKK